VEEAWCLNHDTALQYGGPPRTHQHPTPRSASSSGAGLPLGVCRVAVLPQHSHQPASSHLHTPNNGSVLVVCGTGWPDMCALQPQREPQRASAETQRAWRVKTPRSTLCAMPQLAPAACAMKPQSPTRLPAEQPRRVDGGARDRRLPAHRCVMHALVGYTRPGSRPTLAAPGWFRLGCVQTGWARGFRRGRTTSERVCGPHRPPVPARARTSR
jgi:hypothetical protein